jgi:hypothetical protein
LVLGLALCITKFYNDEISNNAHIAASMKIPLSKLNEVERFILELLDFQLNITSESYS